MKLSIDVDCTPEEARRFMGLPDMAPVHALYLEKIKRAMEDGITPDMMQSLVQTWAPMGEAGFGLWKQLLGQIGTTGKT